MYFTSFADMDERSTSIRNALRGTLQYWVALDIYERHTKKARAIKDLNR